MPHTLIIGRDEDLCCTLVRERLLASGRDAIYLPEDKLFPGLNLAWEMDGTASYGRLELAGKGVAFSDIDGVLARFYGIATSAEDFQSRDGQYLSSEWHALMRAFLQSFTCPVINRPPPQLWYKVRLSVLEMASFAPETKFSFPKTIVTTSMDDARTFFQTSGGRICYSPLTLTSNYIVNRAEDLEKLKKITELMPLFLRQIVPGDAVDAFVIGNSVVFDPPTEGAAEVGQHCAEVSARLGLTFCRFELVNAAGQWYCLGLDSMPYLIDCSDEPRGAIVALLAEALTSSNGRTS